MDLSSTAEFVLIRKDRLKCKGDGVRVYVNKMHKVSKLFMPYSLDNAEDLWITVSSKGGLRMVRLKV